MIAQDIADRFYQQTNDPNRLRTTLPDLLRWITAGQLMMALVRPDTCAAIETLTLAAGSKQSLPEGFFRLLATHRCVDPDDAAKTLSVVRIVDQHTLDSMGNWHAWPQSKIIKNVAYDNRLPHTFWVFPPAKVSSKLEATLTKEPAEVTDAAAELSVDDLYLDPLLEYCLFRYYSYDTEYSVQPQLATGRLQAMSMLLGVKLTRDMAMSPNFNAKGVMPAPGTAVGGV